MSDVDGYIETLLKGEKLEDAQVKNMCERAKEILAKESNVQGVCLHYVQSLSGHCFKPC